MSVQENILIILMLLRHSAVAPTRSSCFFIYALYSFAFSLEILTLTKKAKMNTTIPEKNDTPNWINRIARHVVSMKGSVATIGSWVDKNWSF